MVELNCNLCKNKYKRKPCEAAKSKFCSRKCFVEFKRVTITPPTQRKMEIINGALLGDATITKSDNSNYHLSETHCLSDREYVEWMAEELGDWISSINNNYNLKFPNVTLSCHNHIMWNELREKWYPNGRKIVPKDLSLTPLTLACWHCGDGSNDSKRGVVELLTCGFTIEDNEFLREELLKCFNIKSTIHLSNKILKNGERKIYRSIRIRSESYLSFIDIVKSYIVCKCMQRKVNMTDWVASHRRYKRKNEFAYNGKIYETENVASLARKHNLNVHGLYSLIFGRTLNYKGWTLK